MTDVPAVAAEVEPELSWESLTALHIDCVALLGRATMALDTFGKTDCSHVKDGNNLRDGITGRFSSDIKTMSAKLREIHSKVTSHKPGEDGVDDTMLGFQIGNDFSGWQETFSQVTLAAFEDFTALTQGRALPTVEGPGVTQIRQIMKLGVAKKQLATKKRK